MNLCTMIVWYNPENISSDKNQVTDNILTYSSYFKKVYIVDNSSSDNSELAAQIPNAIYIPLLKNYGIAKALNVGCQRALDDGFDWIMTMDQDSSWNKETLELFLQRVDDYSTNDSNLKSFAPFFNEYFSSIVGDNIIVPLKRQIKKLLHINHQKATIEKALMVITSGNIINLTAWNEIGRFDEKLFIDQVDHDFCLRLNEKYTNPIIKFNDIQLTHYLGDTKRTIFPRVDFHSATRLYYYVRNTSYIDNRYSYVTQMVKGHKKKRRRVFFENLIRFEFKKCRYMIKGHNDYKKSIWGELKL